MKLLLSILSLYVAFSTADYLAARSLDNGNNIELGDLQSLDELYAVLGPGYMENSVYEDVTEYETLATIVEDLGVPTTPVAGRGLATRQNEDVCSDLTGITRMVCDNVPSRWWFWGAGGVLLIWYSPEGIRSWLVSISEAIKAGRDLRNTWRDGTELKRAEDAVDYHFSLPYILNENAEPDATPQLKAASLGEGEETESLHDYVFSERENTIYYKATRTFFTAPNIDTTLESSLDFSNLTTEEAVEKRQTDSCTINLHIVRRTTATTTANPGCLANMLKFHIDRSSETNRFACRPIDNKGSWHATFWLMINKGYRNTGTYGWCC
ncbi:uncharacterized protein LY79DRAFT_702134 [Colletotrichum navitas]|uniref:Uncharacterized protein n=1 Tax=Colletotrichum navitas TaxID=681940 RepID=A0AAD8Q3R6_9PEZI|nr:uncharacterized protein LY79DRAFT_702134 [Colletotrichum navitas]KAK1595402.1 hypothetical protein LY79DRAFT_702134 [Colletotrichum navitas]